MCELLSTCTRLAGFNHPRILGLTAALFRKRCKPSQVNKIITELAETMRCTIELPSNIALVLK